MDWVAPYFRPVAQKLLPLNSVLDILLSCIPIASPLFDRWLIQFDVEWLSEPTLTRIKLLEAIEKTRMLLKRQPEGATLTFPEFPAVFDPTKVLASNLIVFENAFSPEEIADQEPVRMLNITTQTSGLVFEQDGQYFIFEKPWKAQHDWTISDKAGNLICQFDPQAERETVLSLVHDRRPDAVDAIRRIFEAHGCFWML